MSDEIEMAVEPCAVQCKVVVDPSIARKLLRDGYTIVDIKAKKGFGHETVFLFRVENGFMEKFDEYIKAKTAK